MPRIATNGAKIITHLSAVPNNTAINAGLDATNMLTSMLVTTASIVSAFMGAAILFGTMSIYGECTMKSLESWGRLLFVGLSAVVITSVVNLFIGSSVLSMVVSAVAIIVFLGLTAYDTQRIRIELSVYEPDSKAEILGALSLYLNFINIFMSLLQLFGNRDD